MKQTVSAFVLALIAIVFSQAVIPQESNATGRKCGPVVEGLQFCIDSSLVSVQLGEQIPVELSLVNTTHGNVTVPTHGGFNQLYDATVIDPNNKKLLSHYEEVQEKIRNNTATEEEKVSTLGI